MSREEALACVPVKNRAVMETDPDAEEMLLTYPLRVRPWIGRILRGLGRTPADPPRKKLQLDPVGTRVWRLLDGERSVRAVIEAFRAEYDVDPKDAEIAVTRFLRELGRRGVVGLR